MKNVLTLLLFSFSSLTLLGQSSPDTARLVLPIGHTSWITSAVFSPDSKLALTASVDQTARIYEVATGKELHILSGHTDRIHSAVFSPDGKLALTASADGTARIYYVATGKELQILRGHTDEVTSGVFSPNGKMVLTASWDSTARIYDVATGKELQILRGHTDKVTSAVFSPNGKMVLTASWDSTARIYEVTTGVELQILSGATDWIKAVFSPDGKLALTAGGDSTARIYEVSTGKELQLLRGHTNWIKSAVFSKDGNLALTASWDQTARIYEVATGKELQILRGHTKWINSAVFSSDGKLALTASGDSTARIYDVATGKELQLLNGHKGSIRLAVFSPDGKLALTASGDSTARIYEVATGKELQILNGYKGGIRLAVFSPDGKLALIGGYRTARIYEVATGKELQILQGYSQWITSAVFSPDGELALTACEDQTARIYEVATGKELQVLRGHTNEIMSTVFSPNGKMVLTASWDSTARIYEVETGKELQILRGHTNEIMSAVFSPNGKMVLTASWDSTARIYEVETGKELHVLSGHTHWIQSAVFSPNGKLALTASWDSTARIYNVVTGKELHILSGHTLGINSAVFSPDGKYIRTTGRDHKSILWDVATGKPLYTRLQLKNNDWLVYDEHYRFDGTPGAIEQLYFVCGLEVIELTQVKQSLFVRNLVEKIMNKEDLSGYKKLADLNICGKLPLIEHEPTLGKYAYTIQKRISAIVRIEVYLGKKRIKIIDPSTLTWSNNKCTLILDSIEIEALFNPGEENKIKVQAVANVEGAEILGRGASFGVIDQRERKVPTLFGVFVGVNEYNDPNLSLQFSVNDALSVSETIGLGSSALLGQDHVKLYNIHSNYEPEKKNGFGTPTRNTIRQVFQEIAAKAEPQDILFIFLAGHGTMGEQSNKTFTFLTSESTSNNSVGITTDTLFSWIDPEGPFGLKANKAILILDACNSGQLLNDISKRSTEEEEYQKQLDQLSDRSGLFTLSAASPNKEAHEYSTFEHGLLTYSLLRVLKQNPSIYEREDYVNMTKWFYETSRDMEQLTEELNIKQEATPSGTGNFQLLKLDNEIKNRIKLAEEKKQLFFESAENEKEETSDPELVNRLLKKISENESFKNCLYVNEKYSKNAVLIKLKYSIKGKAINCRVIYNKDNKKVNEFLVQNKEGNWTKLESDILEAILNKECP